MDFQLSEDQRAFADMAQSLFADYCTDDKLREHDTSGKPFMQELWQQCVASGLHSILVPEAAGGLGLGTTELLAVLEQQGRALAQVPLWQQQVAAAALAKFGGDDPRVTAAVQSALEGSLIALSLESLVASRGAPLQLKGNQLQGKLNAVALGSQADWALVAFEGFQCRTFHDWSVITWEIVGRQQIAHFHFHQFQQLFIVNHVALVQEHDHVRHAHLAS